MGVSDDIISELFLLIFGIIIVGIGTVVLLYAGNNIGDALKSVFDSLIKKFFFYG